MPTCGNTSMINPSTSCNKPEGMLKMVVFAKDGVSLATHDAGLVKNNWDTLVQSKAIIPMPAAISTEPSNEGAVYEQTPLGSMFVREGRMEMKVNINANLDLHSKIRSIVNSDQYKNVFLVYTSGAIAGTKVAGDVKIYPFSLELLHGEFKTENDGSVGGKTPIHMTFGDPREYQDSPVFLVPTWNPFKLVALKNVQLKVVSSNATTLVVDAYIPHINEAFKNPVEGLVAGDFLLKTAAGVTETIGGVTPDTQVLGRYSITGTGFVTGTADLKQPSTMTTKGFESVGPVDKTVA